MWTIQSEAYKGFIACLPVDSCFATYSHRSDLYSCMDIDYCDSLHAAHLLQAAWNILTAAQASSLYSMTSGFDAHRMLSPSACGASGTVQCSRCWTRQQ